MPKHERRNSVRNEQREPREHKLAFRLLALLSALGIGYNTVEHFQTEKQLQADPMSESDTDLRAERSRIMLENLQRQLRTPEVKNALRALLEVGTQPNQLIDSDSLDAQVEEEKPVDVDVVKEIVEELNDEFPEDWEVTTKNDRKNFIGSITFPTINKTMHFFVMTEPENPLVDGKIRINGCEATGYYSEQEFWSLMENIKKMYEQRDAAIESGTSTPSDEQFTNDLLNMMYSQSLDAGIKLPDDNSSFH